MLFKFLYFFNPRERLLLFGQLILVFIGSGLEIIGIGIIIPFIAMLSNPGIIQEHWFLQKVYILFHFSSDKNFLIGVCFFLMAVFVFKNLYLFFVQYTQTRFFANKTVDLESYLLVAYLSQPYSFFFQHNKSELLNIVIKGVGTFIDRFTKPILVLTAELITIIGILSVMLIMDPMPMLAVLSSVGLLIFLTISLIQKKLVKAGKEMYFYQQNTIKWANQSIDSIKENKVFGKLNYFINKYKEYAYKNSRKSVYVSLVNFTPRLLIESFIFIGIFGFIIFVLLKEIDLRSIIPILAFLGVAAVRILTSTTKIMNSIMSIKQSSYVVQEIYNQLKFAKESISNTEERSFNSIDFKNEIQLKNLVFTYDGAHEKALSGVNLTIKKGQSVAFVGTSGAGKSTLADILLGLLTCEKGSVLIDSKEFNRLNIDDWRKKIGYIPQAIYLLDTSIKENIAFGFNHDEIDDEKVWKALKIAQLDSFVKNLPQQLETLTGENGISISGGQRQRIGIARALYHDPEILIFDEATSALDNETEGELNKAIESLARKKTLIIIAHRMSTVENCDFLYYMENGKVVDSGPFNDLLKRNSEFRKLAKQALVNES